MPLTLDVQRVNACDRCIESSRPVSVTSSTACTRQVIASSHVHAGIVDNDATPAIFHLLPLHVTKQARLGLTSLNAPT